MAEHKKQARKKATGIDRVDKTVYDFHHGFSGIHQEKPAMVKQLNAALNRISRVE